MKRSVRVWVTVITVAILTVLWMTPRRTSLALWAGLQDVPAPDKDEMQVHFLSVGNADAILLRTAATAILIDAGENDDENTVVGYLRRQGIEQLDLVVASHADTDHIGGMDAVIDAFPVDAVWLAFDSRAGTDAASLFASLQKRKIDPVTPILWDTYTIGDVTVQILGPMPSAETSNDRSLMVRVTFGNVSCLFTGDASTEVEQWLIQSGQVLDADLIKAGHHGSATSCSEAFLQAVDPSIAVISCGRNNDHGHPESAVLKRLLARDITVYRTDHDGTVVLTTDGDAIW